MPQTEEAEEAKEQGAAKVGKVQVHVENQASHHAMDLAIHGALAIENEKYPAIIKKQQS